MEVRIEDQLPQHVIDWRGRKWPVAAYLPLSLMEWGATVDWDASKVDHLIVIVAGMLRVDEQVIRDLNPDIAELTIVSSTLADMVGLTPGESPASSVTSAKPATRSRPTSNASTKSTSKPKR